MSNSLWHRISAGVLLGLTLMIDDQVEASRKADEVVGTVTAESTGNRIYVDGVGYNVVPSTRMNSKLSTLRKGDLVDLLMNGSPFDKNAKVVDFVLLSNQGK